MAEWFGAHFRQEVRFSSANISKRGFQVLTSLRYQIVIIIIITFFYCFRKNVQISTGTMQSL